MIYLVRLLPFGIQNFLLISVKIPLWKTRSWASLTISSVSGWVLGRSIWCLMLYDTSTLESLPPQCHTPLSSSKSLNFAFWLVKSSRQISCCCTLVIHSVSASTSSSAVMVVGFSTLVLNLFTALITCAVTLKSRGRVLASH